MSGTKCHNTHSGHCINPASVFSHFSKNSVYNQCPLTESWCLDQMFRHSCQLAMTESGIGITPCKTFNNTDMCYSWQSQALLSQMAKVGYQILTIATAEASCTPWKCTNSTKWWACAAPNMKGVRKTVCM